MTVVRRLGLALLLALALSAPLWAEGTDPQPPIAVMDPCYNAQLAMGWWAWLVGC